MSIISEIMKIQQSKMPWRRRHVRAAGRSLACGTAYWYPTGLVWWVRYRYAPPGLDVAVKRDVRARLLWREKEWTRRMTRKKNNSLDTAPPAV